MVWALAGPADRIKDFVPDAGPATAPDDQYERLLFTARIGAGQDRKEKRAPLIVFGHDAHFDFTLDIEQADPVIEPFVPGKLVVIRIHSPTMFFPVPLEQTYRKRFKFVAFYLRTADGVRWICLGIVQDPAQPEKTPRPAWWWAGGAAGAFALGMIALLLVRARRKRSAKAGGAAPKDQ